MILFSIMSKKRHFKNELTDNIREQGVAFSIEPVDLNRIHI